MISYVAYRRSDIMYCILSSNMHSADLLVIQFSVANAEGIKKSFCILLFEKCVL